MNAIFLQLIWRGRTSCENRGRGDRRNEIRIGLWFSGHSPLAVVPGITLIGASDDLEAGRPQGGKHGGAGRCEAIAVPVWRVRSGSRRIRRVFPAVSSPGGGGSIEFPSRARFPGGRSGSKVHSGNRFNRFTRSQPQPAPSSGAQKT